MISIDEGDTVTSNVIGEKLTKDVWDHMEEQRNASERAKHEKKMRGIRFGLLSSTAMIRVQSIVDRNEEMNSRVNWDQAIDVHVDGIPSKVIVSKHTGDGEKIVCCVYRARPTQFGRFCMKDVPILDEQGNDTGETRRAMRRHDFGLIEKHFGILYDAVPSLRYVINASAYMKRKAA